MNIKNFIPWQAKITAKLVLSRIPLGYRVWQKLDLFKHGSMEDAKYAFEVFSRHYDRCAFPRKGNGFVSLELGPGDSLFSALIARAFGGSSTYLVDVDRFARDDIAPYHSLIDFMSAQGLVLPFPDRVENLDQLLDACSARYETHGVQSLKEIPGASVDFVWSQAVLEHVRLNEFRDVFSELRRIMREDGVCSHRVDLKDHLSGSLNNLRFSEKMWESDLMANSGFYTNRIRYSEMIRMFKDSGFEPVFAKIDRWEHLPLSKDDLDEKFSCLSDEELRISGFDIVLRPI